MPILPPGKISDAGSDRGRKGRRVGGTSAQDALTAADLREECCTTCVQYSPAHTMMITERGPTCPDCMTAVSQGPAAPAVSRTWIWVGAVSGLAVLVIVSAGVYWLFIQG